MPARMRMRWTAYAGVSTALAAGVILKALAQRPNFYSAAVYLSQSSANLMILTNLLFVIACSFLLGLQKLLYGDLRPIEIEQLYEKAWFAVTETCLAMTVFRGEIGLTFLAMFFALLTGKVWGWIGEGRVEVLEQQPPRRPRLFHVRLALSLGLSVAFDLTMLEYTVKQVMRMARPDMMVMFGFEFAILWATSISTALRYSIDLVEIGTIGGQKRKRLEEIKRERVQAAVTAFQAAQSEGAVQPHPADASDAATTTPTPTQRTLEQVTQEALDQPIDASDLEVEGWEDKGRYMFYLNLGTDFVKLVIYLAFFFILLIFYGLPIHILRDVFLTMRSFLKRISDFMKYRTATRDMNARYPDATAEDIGREDVCIICREEMRPYQPAVAEPGQPQPRLNPVAERMRPKKLPCGHVLHFSCLRSWLERQQICPTCRANVVRPAGADGTNTGAGGGAAPANAGQHPPGGRQGPRVYQFGPLRIGVGAARGNMFEQLQQQLGEGQGPAAGAAPPNPDPNAPQQFGVGLRWSRRRRNEHLTTQQQLDALEARLGQDIQELAQNSRELSVLRSMQTELQRLRSLRAGGIQGQPNAAIQTPAPAAGLPPPPRFVQRSTTLVADDPQNIIQAGSDRLPPGLTLPEGWTMMPLQPTQQQTTQQQHNGQGQVQPPWLQFGAMPMFPPNFQQFQLNLVPQPFQATQVPVIPTANNGNNGQAGAPQVNGTQAVPAAAQGQQTVPGNPQVEEMRFTWPQWGPQNHEQLHQQMHQQQMQQHEQLLANLRNQNGQRQAANTNAPADTNGTPSQPAARVANGAQAHAAIERLRRAGEAQQSWLQQVEAAQQAAAQSSSTPSLPSWGSAVPEPVHGDLNSNDVNAQTSEVHVNGNHEDDAEDQAEAASSSQPKDLHPTVEDLVEDPD
ncbi:E3 ubiquitin-protein ligase hrd1 [Cladophialophora chaetospira]|uniref:RING-type E3 ubiquitin transferase n=1 Tax=Cladophialophora chaetospira TaxID=386627 RepID=A0AA38XLX4_9EURO|nr:E3 ubiquitin-protein ligase hrd1 [Cladophialophora chaetospira]